MQGVFFRAETSERARSLGVRGWVRNASDGSVEAVFEGEPEHVEALLRWCRRGPALAEVDDIEVVWEGPRGEAAFIVR